MHRLIESLLDVSQNKERMKGFSMRGTVIRIIKRAKVAASALALFVLFLVPWHGWSSAVAASNVTYPVIFIHGINSDASTWDSPDPTRVSFRKKLEGWGWTFGGYPEHRDGVTIISKTPADFYTLNFSNNQNLSFAQQGAELYEIIKKVKEINQTQKVILVGHSMGGLAARAYLQGLGPQDLFGDDVQLLVTIGTPHQGSAWANDIQLCNRNSPDAFCSAVYAVGVDPQSVSVTELRTDSCTLGVLNYKENLSVTTCAYNANRPATDLRVSRWPPDDVTYTSIIGIDADRHDDSQGDGIVSATSQNFGLLPIAAGLSYDAFQARISGCFPNPIFQSFDPEAHRCETSASEVWDVLGPILAGDKNVVPPRKSTGPMQPGGVDRTVHARPEG